jgi:hypothetical protein
MAGRRVYRAALVMMPCSAAFVKDSLNMILFLTFQSHDIRAKIEAQTSLPNEYANYG